MPKLIDSCPGIIIYEYIPGITYKQLLVEHKLTDSLLQVMAQSIFRLHQAGLIFKDPRLGHFLISPQQEFFIFDYEEVEYRDFGLQTSTRSILRNSNTHITLFAIASVRAREQIGAETLGNDSFMTNSWWREADQSPWAAIENHGWDHCHPAVSEPVGGAGTFSGVSDFESCNQQVNIAADSIAAITGRRPDLLAYPYGESSDFLRNTYLPEYENEHGMRAAVSTTPDYASLKSNRWDIPRFICGRDWNSPEGFQQILDQAKRSW